jgi:hypothetical protein
MAASSRSARTRTSRLDCLLCPQRDADRSAAGHPLGPGMAIVARVAFRIDATVKSTGTVDRDNVLSARRSKVAET